MATAGAVFGRFTLIAELGRGGMSDVYLALVAGPAGFNKLVVVKLIKAELSEEPEFVAMFLEEARLSARLSHPNVVQTNEVGEVDGQLYIAMEYLEGQPFSRVRSRLQKDQAESLGVSLRILRDVLEGIHYAHELQDFDGTPLQVVHRDISPQNIFVTYDGQAKVVDFGIAKAMSSSHETKTGTLKGKLSFMAPEQARSEVVDRRADIFSIGVMLWEAVVGRPLWKGLSDIQVLRLLSNGEIPSPSAECPTLSPALAAVITKALAPDRERRYATALDLQADLDRVPEIAHARVTTRDVGRLVSTAFDGERQKLRVAIERHVARPVAVAPGGRPPRIMTAEHVITSTGTPSGMSSRRPRLNAPPPDPEHAGTPTNASDVFEVVLASHSSPRPRPRWPIALAAGGLAVIVAGLGGGYLWLRGGVANETLAAGPPMASPAAPMASPAAPMASSPAPAAMQASAEVPPAVAEVIPLVTLDVRATPAKAAIFLDGVRLGTGKLKTTVPADVTARELRVEAAGHVPLVRMIEPDELVVAWQPTLDVERRRARPAPPPAPPATPARDKNGKIIRPIDKTYPGLAAPAKPGG